MKTENIRQYQSVGRTGEGLRRRQVQVRQSILVDPEGAGHIRLALMTDGRVSRSLLPLQPSSVETVTAGNIFKGAVLRLDRPEEIPELQGTKKRVAMQLLLQVRGAYSSP